MPKPTVVPGLPSREHLSPDVGDADESGPPIGGVRNALGLPGWVGWTSPVVAALAAAAAGFVWRFAVRHYRGTGS